MIEQMTSYPDPAAKLTMVTDTSWGIRAATCALLTESSAEMAVNEWDRGRVIVIGVDVAAFADTQDTRLLVEEGCGHVEVLVTFVDNHGHYVQTERIGEEVG